VIAINDKVLTGEERRRAPVAREAAGVLINGRDFHPLLLQNTKGTHLLGDFMCLQYIHRYKEFSSPLFALALLLSSLPMVSFTYWSGKVLVLADTLSRFLEGMEYKPSSGISKQMAEMIPPMEAKPGDRMNHEDFIKFLMDPAEENSLVDLWSTKRKVPQPKETLTELLVCIQK
jgi:hypothetical protein